MNDNAKKPRKRTNRRAILISLGCCCLIGAVALSIYNQWDSERASEESLALMDSYSELLAIAIPDQEEAEATYNIIDPEEAQQNQSHPDETGENVSAEPQMKHVAVNNFDICGIINVPAIDIKMAVIYDWSYPNLKSSACRYSGTPDSQMIVIAHNYKRHFGGLNRLNPGDKVEFASADGKKYIYKVTGTETWATDQLREIIAGDDWDLTLFTCTFDGNHRIVVRCERETDDQ